MTAKSSRHVLVIGGTRFVGRQLVWRLLAGGHRVTLLNRGRNPDPFADRVERLVGDRTTDAFEPLLSGRRFDAVVDFAAYHGDDVRRAVSALGDGRAGHYVVISTGQVYLVREDCPTPAREQDYDGSVMAMPAEPREREEWEYGMGKREGEDVLAAAWETARFPGTRLRIPMVNGERDYLRRIEGLLWRLLDGGPILLPDGGLRPMRHVYGGEVARAVAALLGDERTFGQAYNLAQDETPTLEELLRMLAEALGSSPRLVPVPAARILEAGLQLTAVSPFSGRWMSFLDPTRIRTELGFEHEPLRQYLGKIVASFLAHPPASPPDGYQGREQERALAARV